MNDDEIGDPPPQHSEAVAEIARLRAALEEIVALEPEKKRHSQHEYYIAMLKALDIARKTLDHDRGCKSLFTKDANDCDCGLAKEGE